MKTTEERKQSILNKYERAKRKARRNKQLLSLGLASGLVAAVFLFVVIPPMLNQSKRDTTSYELVPEDAMPEKAKDMAGVPMLKQMDNSAEKNEEAKLVEKSEEGNDSFYLAEEVASKENHYKKVKDQAYDMAIREVQYVDTRVDSKSISFYISTSPLPEKIRNNLPALNDNEDTWHFKTEEESHAFYIKSGLHYLGGNAEKLTTEELRAFLTRIITMHIQENIKGE